MKLNKQIQEDIKVALKGKQAQKLSTLRMLKAAIQNKEIQKRTELTDEEILDVVRKEVKSYSESLEAFTKDNRTELMKETSERIETLMVYLPKQLTKEEVEVIVNELIIELQITSAKEKGKLMQKLMPKVKGIADGRIVNEVVTALLNK